MSYSYNTSSGKDYSYNPYSGGYAPSTYNASSYTYANQQNNNWDDNEHEYYEQQYNQEEEEDDGQEEEDDCQEEEDDCQEDDDCQEEEDDCQEEEEEADNGYTELYRDDLIVGKCYFAAYIDSKDIDTSQHNNWKYYAPHNQLVYMGEFQRLKSTSWGHTGSTTYYFSDGSKVSAEYTPLLCFLEA
jgi:hypothetical protein